MAPPPSMVCSTRWGKALAGPSPGDLEAEGNVRGVGLGGHALVAARGGGRRSASPAPAGMARWAWATRTRASWSTPLAAMTVRAPVCSARCGPGGRQ